MELTKKELKVVVDTLSRRSTRGAAETRRERLRSRGEAETRRKGEKESSLRKGEFKVDKQVR
jgi:hypothetical protein